MISIKEYDKTDPYLLVKRILPDGRVVRLYQMLGQNTRIALSKNEDDDGFLQLYCYHNKQKAIEQANLWDGNSDPDGWYKHINTGRRRPNGDPEKEYIER